METGLKIVGFQPSPAHRVSAEKATIYGEELLRIERERGSLENRIIVEEGRQKSSPLLDWFTEGVESAAEKRWLDEAGDLKQAIEVRVQDSKGHEYVGPITIALRVQGTADEPGGLRGNRIPVTVRSLLVTLKQPGGREQMMLDCIDQLLWLRRRFDVLGALAGDPLHKVWREVDAVAERYGRGESGRGKEGGGGKGRSRKRKGKKPRWARPRRPRR